jgi:uncharacterized protein
MERREAFDKTLAGLRARIDELTAYAGSLGQTLAANEAAIDAELETELAARTDLASQFSPEIVAQYERRRAQAKGVGAARLVGTSCQGCHLAIPSVEAERIRKAPPGTLAFCDNCGCILIP